MMKPLLVVCEARNQGGSRFIEFRRNLLEVVKLCTKVVGGRDEIIGE